LRNLLEIAPSWRSFLRVNPGGTNAPIQGWLAQLEGLPFDHFSDAHKRTADALAVEMTNTPGTPLARELVAALAAALRGMASGLVSPWDALPYVRSALELLAAGESNPRSLNAARYELETLLPPRGPRTPRTASPDVPLSALRKPPKA